MTKFEVAFNIPDSMWLTSNQRKHWAVKARATKELRLLAVMTARAAQLPHLQSAHITAHIQYRTNGRADPHNAMPTLKALIDGLVQDYGLLPDDSDKYLLGPDMRRDTGKSAPHTHRIRLVVTGTKTMPPTTTQSQGKTDSAGTIREVKETPPAGNRGLTNGSTV